MLVQFCFKNFKLFKDDTILDISATKTTEYSDRIIDVGNEKLLFVAAIYGANASGKSNVIEAFRFMVTYVLESFSYGGDTNDKKSKNKRIKHTPFFYLTLPVRIRNQPLKSILWIQRNMGIGLIITGLL